MADCGEVDSLVRSGLIDGVFRADHPEDFHRFRDIVEKVGRALFRNMPWRDNTDPYWILVSEVMLQQTQVSRVIEKFGAFVDRFPDVGALAVADLQEVMKLWSGLGYNRRARFLRETARIIDSTYGGTLPDDPAVLVNLPGIGPNTAGSIAAFAYNRPVVFIETNIRRVFLTAFFQSGTQFVHDREIYPLIDAALPADHPREWYWNLMDIGVCLSRIDGNANRRSAHYATQSPFENSQRQLRGRILHRLSHEGMTAAEELPEYTGFSGDEVSRAVETLEREGLVQRSGRNGRYLVISR